MATVSTRRHVAVRAGKPIPIGNEGAGTIVAAGDDPAAQALLGKIIVRPDVIAAYNRRATGKKYLILPQA